MNHSICSADRTTHLKIVVVAMILGIAAASLAISLHSRPDIGVSAVKDAKPVMMTSSAFTVIR
jgi:hypothetical protein